MKCVVLALSADSHGESAHLVCPYSVGPRPERQTESSRVVRVETEMVGEERERDEMGIA